MSASAIGYRLFPSGNSPLSAEGEEPWRMPAFVVCEEREHD